MSEKRFEYDKCTGIKDLSIDEDDDQFLYPTQIVDLLNELSTNCSQLQEENEQLEKGKMEALSLLGGEIDKNEQLRKEIRAYPLNEEYAEEIIRQNQKLRCEIYDLRRENEQLERVISNNLYMLIKLRTENEQLKNRLNDEYINEHSID